MAKNWGFCGPSYTAQSPNVDDEDAMNCYCERSESTGAKVPIALLGTPGRKVFAQFPESSIPFDFTVNGRTFFAASQLYEVDASGNVTVRGSLGAAPTRPTMITANETQLVILNNGDLFVLTLATNAFIVVNMGQFNGPINQIGFDDGYIIATLQDSHTFQVSNLEDATTWSGLDIATLSLFPDNIVSLLCDHREAWFYSGKKTAVYYNAGAGFPPFIPVQGAFLEDGAAATFATVQLDNSAFWLAQDERGFLTAKRASGYAGERVSTHAIESEWQSFATTADAIGWTYQENGHPFWVILFPTVSKSWAYDVSTGFWHRRGFWNARNGTYIADRAMCHTFNFGKHLVGDWASGTVYDLSSKYFDDFGNVIRGYRRTPTISDENKFVQYPSIEFDIDAGLAPIPPILDGDGQPRPAQLMLRWSNDGGRTWSNTYSLSVGAGGEYSHRVIKRMLGRARKRIWEVSWTDPIPWRFADAYLELVPED